MNKLRKYLVQIRIIILLLTACGLFLYRDASSAINKTVERLYYSVMTDTPDSNVIIIHINQSDIRKAGGWPISRGYYSQLIEKLNELNCRKIGIEVFLSERNEIQPADELLIANIYKAGNVVLSSVFSAYSSKEQSAELLLPHPRVLMSEVKTGHINYYGKDGIHIPLMFQSSRSEEPAFSLALADPDSSLGKLPSVMKLNFFSSWNKFRNYSLMDFLNIVQTGSRELNSLAGKTVIIGISSPQVAQTASTLFDNDIPGVAIHAFALDNILHKRYIKKEYKQFSAFLIILLLTALILFFSKKNMLLVYTAAFVFLFIAGLFLFRLLYIELNYAMFIVPIFILLLFESILANRSDISP